MRAQIHLRIYISVVCTHANISRRILKILIFYLSQMKYWDKARYFVNNILSFSYLDADPAF